MKALLLDALVSVVCDQPKHYVCASKVVLNRLLKRFLSSLGSMEVLRIWPVAMDSLDEEIFLYRDRGNLLHRDAGSL